MCVARFFVSEAAQAKRKSARTLQASQDGARLEGSQLDNIQLAHRAVSAFALCKLR